MLDWEVGFHLVQNDGIHFVSCYSHSFESMQRLCDKYNRAIDSIHQLVSPMCDGYLVLCS